ncbi:RNA-directed DNA polymerase, eukaryota [Tanacetum coccineum]|uniref:RNA-directed DNA polymerase, eukaryota n=1 Tax=Tanacetum coccineum TaxID=301880 RepID=A0ABQ5BJC4_9ASTR
MKGQIYWIQVKELEAWCPDFDVDQEDNNSSEEESEYKPSNSNESVDPNKSEDPFEIYKILKKKKEPEFKASGSILDVMDELIKVGQAMGYNMDGCMKNIESIIGDFNEVRYEQERYGTVFNLHGANTFNNFITMTGLVDLPIIKGYSLHVLINKSASKMSKLYRFLITEGLLSLFPSISALCLNRHLSDHRPIIMRELNTDYGPTPFRFFHSWTYKKGFDELVESS